MGVVEELEVVEVDDDDRERFVELSRRRQLPVERLERGAVVEQPGQTVRFGPPLQLAEESRPVDRVRGLGGQFMPDPDRGWRKSALRPVEQREHADNVVADRDRERVDTLNLVRDVIGPLTRGQLGVVDQKPRLADLRVTARLLGQSAAG